MSATPPPPPPQPPPPQFVASSTNHTPNNNPLTYLPPQPQPSLDSDDPNNDHTVHNKRRKTGATTTTTLLSEKKLRRLEKNRLSARECRRRKKEATENMQRQINLLEGENLRLRLQLQIGEEAEATSQQEQQKLTENLDDLLKSGASESEVYTKIEEYKEKFADYGRDRRSAIEFHLRNVERLLLPTQTTNVVLATLHMGHAVQPEEAPAPPPTTSTNPPAPELQPPFTSAPSSSSGDNNSSTLTAKSLFSHLVKFLEVTPEQAVALKDSRLVAKEMDQCLQASLDVVKELRGRLTQCGEDLEQEFNIVRSILTPTQAAKFLVWVANNKACMHLLNELWIKVYPPDVGEYGDVGGTGSSGSIVLSRQNSEDASTSP